MAYQVIPGSPVVQGAQQGMNLARSRLQAQEQKERLKTLPEALQAQLIQQQQAAEQAKYKTQFMPDSLKAQLALQQAQLPNLQAQTAQTQMRTSLMPRQMSIQEQNALSRALGIEQSRQRFNPQTALVRAMNIPAVQQLHQSNPQFAAAFDRAIMGTASLSDQQVTNKMLEQLGVPVPQAAGSGGQQKNRGLTEAFMQQIGMQGQQGQQPQALGIQQGQQPQDLGAQQGQQQPSLEQALQQQMAQRQQANQLLGLTPEQIKATQQASGSALAKKEATERQQNARIAGGIIDDIVKDVEPNLDDIFSFSGLKGQAKLLGEKGFALAGEESDAYDKYKIFHEQTIPTLAAKMRQLAMSPATQKEVDSYIDIVGGSNSLSTPPKLKKKAWKNLVKTLKQMETVEAKGLGQVTQELREDTQAVPPVETTTSMAIPGHEVLVMPQFQSKEQFSSWFQQLSPQQKAQARAQVEAKGR